jgi:hypothetical protein
MGSVTRPRLRWSVPAAVFMSLLVAGQALALSWSAPTPLTASGDAFAGGLATLGTSTVVAAYDDGGRIFVQRSTNSGTSWAARIRLAKLGFDPAIAARGKKVDVVWVSGAEGRMAPLRLECGEPSDAGVWRLYGDCMPKSSFMACGMAYLLGQQMLVQRSSSTASRQKSTSKMALRVRRSHFGGGRDLDVGLECAHNQPRYWKAPRLAVNSYRGRGFRDPFGRSTHWSNAYWGHRVPTAKTMGDWTLICMDGPGPVYAKLTAAS